MMKTIMRRTKIKTTAQRCRQFAGGLLGTLAAFVLASALTLAPLTAHAQQATNGGNGGNAGSGSGANGANGSDGVLLTGISSVASGTFTAGSGGNGGSGNVFNGGNGGNGGNAAVAQAGSTVTVTGGTFTASSGGNGGGSLYIIAGGGSGGSGGSALVALTDSSVTVMGGTFSVGRNGSAGAGSRGGAGGKAGYDLLANGGAITVYGYGFSPGSVGPSLTGSGTLTATIGGVTQTLSYSVSSAAGSALFLKNSGTLATTTALTVSPNPSVAGQLVTLTAAVTSSGGMPTGSVTFQLGNATLGTVPLASGTATFTTHGLPLGSDTLTAYYTGDSSFAPSSGGFVQTVMPTSADVVAEFLGGPEIPATSNSGYFGQSFTTITASPVTNIAFSFEAAPYSTASPYALGTAYLLSSPYTGLPSGLSSQTPGFLGVTTASGGVYNFGASVTLQPHTQYFLYENALFPNDAIYGGGQYAGGTVYYALPSSLPPPLSANHPFVPDPGSNSACFLVTGVPLSPPYSTTTGLTSSVNPSVVGQSVTFTAAVASNGGMPTGTVQFAVDGADVGGPVMLDSNGKATDTEAGLAVGAHTVTVTYAPTSAFLGNAGASLTQFVHITPQYVSPSGSDGNNGSQASPKRTIQAAINTALSGDTVIVEDGTYSGDCNRDLDFGGKNLTVRSQHGAASTLIDCGGSSSALHRGFYFHSGETAAVVSGLSIQNGYVTSIDSTPTNPNSDGGAVTIASGSTVTLTDCVLTGNQSVYGYGGGVCNYGTLSLTNCTIFGNIGEVGGGVLSFGSATLINCTVAANTSFQTGSGLCSDGIMTLVNCTISGNITSGRAGTGASNYAGGISNLGGTVALTNCICSGNTDPEIGGNGGVTTTATYCDVRGGYAGTGNINADPLFVRAPADLHLRIGSPCLGAGTPSGAPPTDKDGSLRPSPPSIGAYDRVAGHTHLLWNNSDGRVMLWSVAPDGSFTLHGFGPYTDGAPQNVWHATAVATGADGVSHLLWNNTDGRVMLWTVDDQGNFTYSGYGPYTDNAPQNKWSATAVSVGPDGIVHLLWNNTDHRVMLWNVAPDFTFTLAGYGPYTDDYVSRDPGNLWSAAALATGPDNVSRIVWNNADGRVMLWDVGSSFNFTLAGYGPYTDGAPQNKWSAVGVSVGPDNLTHLLWSNTDRRAMFWNVDSAFGFTLAGYGPYTDDAPQNLWSATAVATGPDGLSHLLWGNTDDRAMLWGVDNAFGFTVAGYGPYTDGGAQNLWSATAVSAGP